MKFLLDEHLPVGLVGVIADLGHDALHVKSEALLSVSDREIWAAAEVLGATVVSKDSDFITLAARDGRPAGLVHLNLGNLANRQLYETVRLAWPRLIDQLERGESIVELRP